MNKPSPEQVAWVFKHLCDAMREPGTFRYLIYDRMGFPPEAYSDLYHAGGMALTNAFAELEADQGKVEKLTALARRFIADRGCTCNEADHRCGTNQMYEDLEAVVGEQEGVDHETEIV